MNRYTIYNSETFDVILTGFYEEQPENSTTSIPEVTYYKARYNPNNDTFYEGATEEEILKIKKGVTPEIITRRQFKLALDVLGKNEQDVLDGINSLPIEIRSLARISYSEATTFERHNPELILVGTQFLNMTEEDIDNVFIIGNRF
jgi:spore germination protein YaaH